ncbi:Aste57867_3113 [Aphanomyces stellatus]|uniref:Aste57867_3113 protein n=1 Tax=Aphanomyces stellatus TaxID=120398 RepID=A0A485KCS6_9STRA|nr:hypothetical protein As57867_003104 [Aphanomyces stellatus]VFT80289.1 Aste57867_3113 [Aphanomyces stellatus]
MSTATPSSPIKSPTQNKSPLHKRPRVNTEGHDGTETHGNYEEDDENDAPVSPSKKSVTSPSKKTSPSKTVHTSPRKTPTNAEGASSAPVAPAFGGFSAFANTNPFQAVAKTTATGGATTGFAAFASGGFGTTPAASTGFSSSGGFGSGGFGSSFGSSSGFGTTFGSTAASTASTTTDATDDAAPVAASTWTEANDNNAEFLNTEADKVEIQNLVIPKVDLPKDYHHVTGEENDDVLIHLTGKLYKLVDGEYVECGAGPLKVLEPKDKSSRGRFVMRRATSDFKAGTQLLLNALLSSMPNAVAKGKSIIVPVLVDANTITTYLVRLDSVENAEKLLALIKP